jgi:hypothetical protein
MKRGLEMPARPGQRFQRLIELHAQMHRYDWGKPFGRPFEGSSLIPHISQIRDLAITCGAKTMLDYGSGKGAAYFVPGFYKDPTGRFSTAAEALGDLTVTCYDPAIPEFSALPDAVFDGVVCTDVMEHLAEEDVPWVLNEIFAKAKLFVFMTIAAFPAKKSLPDGRNAHSTVRPLGWWKRHILAARKHKGCRFVVKVRSHNTLARRIGRVFFGKDRMSTIRGTG